MSDLPSITESSSEPPSELSASELSKYFGIVDIVVFVASLLASGAIGMYHAFAGAGQKTTRDYLHGGKNIGWFPVALSVLATTISANTMLGTPADVYLHTTMYGYLIISLSLA